MSETIVEDTTLSVQRIVVIAQFEIEQSAQIWAALSRNSSMVLVPFNGRNVGVLPAQVRTTFPSVNRSDRDHRVAAEVDDGHRLARDSNCSHPAGSRNARYRDRSLERRRGLPSLFGVVLGMN